MHHASIQGEFKYRLSKNIYYIKVRVQGHIAKHGYETTCHSKTTWLSPLSGLNRQVSLYHNCDGTCLMEICTYK